MKNIILLFLFLIPVFLFAQYPATGNKSRLGYQTTGDGLIWRGVAADTAIKPRTTANAYFQLDTVNRILRRYIATQGSWQVVGGGGTNVDSLIYATRYWVNSNFFPLEGGTLTGTGGAGFIGFPSQVSAPGTPASGLNVYAQGSSFNWKGTDGYERQFASILTGGRTYTLPDVSGTFILGTGTTNYIPKWATTNTQSASNLFDNNTYSGVISRPWKFGEYTTAGLPTGVTGYTVYNTTINGPGWYNGTRWAYALESTFARGTATRVPFFDANGQVTEDIVSGQGLRYYNGGSNYILEAKSAFVAQGVTGFNSGNADLATRTATGNGYWAFSAAESSGTFSFYDAAAGQTPFSIVKSAGNSRFLIASTTNTLSSSTSTTINSPSLYFYQGTSADALGFTGQFVYKSGSNIMSFSNNTTEPYFAVTNGTIRVFGGHTNTSDGGVFGTYSNHKLTLRTNNTNRLEITTGGNLLLGTTTDVSRRLHVSGEARITDLTTDTPTRIVGADADGDLGAMTVAGGLSIAGGVLTGANIYTASDSIRGNRYVEMANDGNSTTAFGYFPSFPDWSTTQNTFGMFYSAADYEEIDIIHGLGANFNYIGTGISGSYMNAQSKTAANKKSRLDVGLGKIIFKVSDSGESGKFWQILLDTSKFEITRNISGTDISYNLLPDSEYPSTASAAKTALQWTGNGSSANPSFVEVKRDTTIFVTADTDYNFSAAATTAQIASRYNRVIIHMTLTSGVGADKTTTLHTPDANLMQCEILIRGTDNTGTYDNEIAFGTNNAISSDGTNTSGYTLAQGQGLHVRVVYNGSAYKYIYY